MVYTQKIIKVGNSAAITIPKEFLDESGLKVGDEIAVEANGKLKSIYAKPQKMSDQAALTPEFKEWLDKFTEEYKPILKKLANI